MVRPLAPQGSIKEAFTHLPLVPKSDMWPVCLNIGFITYFALTQLFPVLVTDRFPIVKYTRCGAFSAFHLGVCRFLFSHGCVHIGQMDFISSIFARYFSSKLSWNHFTDHTL